MATEQAVGEKGTIIEGEPLPGQTEEEAAAIAEARATTETQARNLGWVPQNEFRGDLDKWKDADEFVKVGEELLPVLRENLRKLHTKIDGQNTKIDEQGVVIKQFAGHYKKVEATALKKAIAALEKERLDAVDEGDVEAFEKVDKALEDLKKTDPAVVEPGSEEGAERNPAFTAWAKDNPWYNSDDAMTVFADQVGGRIATNNPGITNEKLYEKVSEAMATQYPDKFKNQRRAAPNTVEGDTRGPGPTGAKTFADLPEDAQKACKGFVKEELLTEAQYIKDYFEDEVTE